MLISHVFCKVPAPEESKSGPVKSGETPRSYADVVGVGASVSSHEVCAGK